MTATTPHRPETPALHAGDRAVPDAGPTRLPRRPDGSLDLAPGLRAGRRARSQAAWRCLHALARAVNPHRLDAPARSGPPETIETPFGRTRHRGETRRAQGCCVGHRPDRHPRDTDTPETRSSP
jgi:hypothetical protein